MSGGGEGGQKEQVARPGNARAVRGIRSSSSFRGRSPRAVPAVALDPGMVGLAPELREKKPKKEKSGPKPLIAHELKKAEKGVPMGPSMVRRRRSDGGG